MKKILMFVGIAAFAMAGLIFTSCETESVANNDLTISPVSVALYKDQYADFTAAGGYEYSWSLSDSTLGILSQTTGPTVRYTNRYDPGSNGSASAVQTITVQSVIANSAGGAAGSTNGTLSTLASAQAIVEHLATPTEPVPSADLYISPSSASIAQWASQEFTASGGSGQYTWRLQTDGYGRLTAVSGSKTTYTSTYDPGESNTVFQILYLNDSDGRQISANILHTQ